MGVPMRVPEPVLTKHAMARARMRNVDIKFASNIIKRYAQLLKEKEIKIKAGNTVIVARRDKKGTPVVITMWREK